MKRSWTITFFQHDQPDTGSWNELVAFARGWNKVEIPLFAEVMGFMWHITFDESNITTRDTLLEEFNSLKNRKGIVYHQASRNTLEEHDYATADFIEILGVDLGSEHKPFVVNGPEVLEPCSPCRECGWSDLFDWRQTGPFSIDEELLELPADGQRPGRGGWDLVNLPGGHKLVSEKVVGLLRDNRVQGYKLHNVINGQSQQISSRVFQLLADTSFLTPCMKHTQIYGEPFCAACGTAHGNLEDYYWLRNDWVVEREVISRHPAGGAMLYVSRHLYALMVSAGVSGLKRNEVLSICDHSAG